MQMNESFDEPATPSSGAASLASGTTSRSHGCRQHSHGVAGADDLDSMSGVTCSSSLACSRCSYVTGFDVSESASTVFATTASPVSSCTSSSSTVVVIPVVVIVVAAVNK